MIINGEYMTSGSASKLMGVHKTTLFRWEKEGLIVVHRFPVGSETYRAYKISDLQALKDSLEMKAKNEQDKRRAYTGLQEM